MSTHVKPTRIRDPRLDFFRGIAMFIILLAHTPGNPWTLWIPARFGFSDATEIFVFCSGMASAIAFGGVFDRWGLPMGSLRIAHRVWQVYWSHVAMFIAVLVMVVALNATGMSERDYVGQLNLYPWVENPLAQTLGLLTLTYVPNYFDILPMYLVILAMIPLMMGLSRISVQAVFAAMLVLWLGAQVGRFHAEGWESLAGAAAALSFMDLPAQYWFEPPNDTREWFFNPFGWQLVFFTGFAFMRGWIPAPPVNRWLIALAALVVLANIPVSNVGTRIWTLSPVEALNLSWAADYRAWVFDWRTEYREFFNKTDFGPFRYIHFLSLAYLAWAAVGPMGARLSHGRVWTGVVGVIRKVGQQSLAVFVTSMVLARLLGFLLDVYAEPAGGGPKDSLTVLTINAFGFGAIVATAYLVAWFKGEPWRKHPPAPAEALPAAAEGRAA